MQIKWLFGLYRFYRHCVTVLKQRCGSLLYLDFVVRPRHDVYGAEVFIEREVCQVEWTVCTEVHRRDPDHVTATVNDRQL